MSPTTPPGGPSPPVPEPAFPGHIPLFDPGPPAVGDRPGLSSGTIETLHGDLGLSTWAGDEVAVPANDHQVELRLAPDRPVVIGRQETGIPPYLDPAFRSTTIVPGTEQSVLRSAGHGRDTCVSRAHFMLRGDARGIVLTNGVPRPGGGIRPPVNATWLLEPAYRAMGPAEEHLIERGSAAVLWLVNGTVLRIRAE
jgi:hypothetical protein